MKLVNERVGLVYNAQIYLGLYICIYIHIQNKNIHLGSYHTGMYTGPQGFGCCQAGRPDPLAQHSGTSAC